MPKVVTASVDQIHMEDSVMNVNLVFGIIQIVKGVIAMVMLKPVIQEQVIA